jgi:hypothetical protein
LLVASSESLDDLCGRVACDYVAADEIATGSVKENDSVGVPAYLISLDLVPLATALKPDTEIDIPVCIIQASITVE